MPLTPAPMPPTPAPARGVLAAALLVALHATPLLAQVTDLTAVHQSGQTFLTWTEPSGTGIEFRVYRSDAVITAIDGSVELLGTVDDATSENLRVTLLDGAPSFFAINSIVFCPGEISIGPTFLTRNRRKKKLPFWSRTCKRTLIWRKPLWCVLY